MRRCVLFLCAVPLFAEPALVQFRPHVVEAKLPGGYAVIVVDVNKDGRPDIIPMTQRVTELAWYENPGWQRHVLIPNLNAMVNLAAHDLDGDGIPEIAVQNEFSMVAAKSRGLNWLFRSQGDVKQPWRGVEVDELTTSHHVAWADLDGDGHKELINAPLIGAKALAPKYEDHVSLVFYRTPADLSGKWKRETIDDKLFGVVHRVRPAKWTPGRRDQVLLAGFDGIVLYSASGAGNNLRWQKEVLSKGHEEEAPRAGASDVKLAALGKRRILASIEPWHGNEVVVYTEGAGRKWERSVIFSELTEGHEVCTADFNRDGLDDIVAGDRARGKPGSAHVFFAGDGSGTKWRHEIIDRDQMSGSGCQVADINRDGRMDFVMVGSATGNLKWYENLGSAGRD
jgi:hypothetical protein